MSSYNRIRDRNMPTVYTVKQYAFWNHRSPTAVSQVNQYKTKDSKHFTYNLICLNLRLMGAKDSKKATGIGVRMLSLTISFYFSYIIY